MRRLPVDWTPILADALEDAGCTDAELLGHLRGPGPHVRGCRALDFVLSKIVIPEAAMRRRKLVVPVGLAVLVAVGAFLEWPRQNCVTREVYGQLSMLSEGEPEIKVSNGSVRPDSPRSRQIR